jgi:GDP-mannose 6-dehydrogenase
MDVVASDRKLNCSPAYLRPGFAFGGSCLPKDLRALMHLSRRSDLKLPLLESVLESNERHLQRGIDLVLKTRKRRIGVLGLAFKSGTDDLRESPLVRLVESLIGKGLEVRVHDRNVSIARLVGANRRYIEKEIPHIAEILASDPDDLVRWADVLVIGNGGEEHLEAARRFARAGGARGNGRTPGERIVVDLVRPEWGEAEGAASKGRVSSAEGYRGLCW